MISAKTLAKYLIYLMRKIQGKDYDLTPMKLQKLLYYCQGYSLALTGKPIFAEPIEAWEHGPVVDSVYQEYKKYRDNIIPVAEINEVNGIDETIESVAQMVVDEKKWFSGYALSNATHKETPWLDTFGREAIFHNDVISNEKIKKFFSDEFSKWEESEDEEDSFWLSKGKTLSRERLEAALAEL
ncbi:MAG: DUF4065 domain-containing protein [Synergistaceae bacterium]|nr:DUF4065 domain-containing protein [Synergistaceae bacterium]